ncbi:MAG TPA: glycosyltransferase [Candidatus Saccharimonadales bacterium]|nr:glycosyltransferase [Candidatus Saccharimonadales bacterium]
MPKQAPKISVVIPSYNEAEFIHIILESLADQDFKDFEVIVSDAQSKDGIDKMVKNFASSLDIKLIEAPPKGPAFGRNEGAEQARGEWLLFLDADVRLHSDNFVSTLLAQTEKNNWGTSSAKLVTRDATTVEKIGTWIDYHYIKLLSRTKHPVAPGYCILTRTKLFRENGGFDESIHFGEDYDYVIRVGRSGFGFVEAVEYSVDLRRFRNEGFLWVLKTIWNEIYRFTHGFRPKHSNIKYEFGKHKKRGD